MNHIRRNLLIGYLTLAHVLGAILLWQNAVLRNDLTAAHGCQPDASSTCPYQDRMVQDLVRAYAQPAGAVHFLGDSILANMDQTLLEQPVLNLGLRGDTTVGVHYRASRYPFLADGQATIIHVGVNDVLQNNATPTAANINKIVTLLAARTSVILSALLPVAERQVGAQHNASIRSINAQIEAHCVPLKNCVFVDTWVSLADADGQLKSELHTGDGIHLNAAGYANLSVLYADALAGTSQE